MLEPTKAEEEPDKEEDLAKEIPPQRTSYGFIMFNVFFVLVMAVLVFMIVEVAVFFPCLTARVRWFRRETAQMT